MNYNILLYQIAGNTLSRYFVFLAAIVGSLIFLKLFIYIILSKIERISINTESNLDDTIIQSFRKNLVPLMYLSAIYFSTGVLNINSAIENKIYFIFLVLSVFFITRFGISVSVLLINKFWFVESDDDTKSNISVLINTLFKIIVWSISLLVLLDNLGIKVSGLIAGLGVGGVAIAFASQSILRDIFNYFTIFFDRPFEIGDFLVIDEYKGNVEHIGIKTTRLRSLSGEQLIFANTDLTGSRVRNYKTMLERRVLFNFGVTYQTPPNKLKLISEKIQKIIETTENAKFDRAHFYRFGDSSLDYEVVYYVLSPEYSVYMDVQQEINLKLMSLFKKMKVEFAYPTRTLYINR